ncbi:MAG: CHAT domain-containing protein [Bacteroidota bacterium]
MPPFLFHQKIDSLLKIENNELKLSQLNRLIPFSKSLNDSSKAILLTRIANTQRKLQEKSKALQSANQGSFYLNKIQKQKSIALSLAAYEIAACHHVNSLYMDALKYYELSTNFSPDSLRIAYCYKLMGDINGELGDHENQFIYLNNSKKYLGAPNNKYSLACDIYNSIGLFYLNSNNPKASYSYFQNSLEFYRKSNDNGNNSYLLANAYLNLGTTYNDLHEVSNAEQFYLKAIQFYEKNGQKELILENGYTNLLFTNLVHKNWDKSLFWQKKAEKLMDELDLPQKSLARVKIYNNSGYLFYNLKNYEKALFYFKKAIDSFSQLNPKKPNFDIIRNRITAFDLFGDVADCYLANFKQNGGENNINQSLLFYSFADQLLDRMRQEQQGMQSKTFWREHGRSLYEMAIEACYLTKDYNKAFYYLEKSRSMLLLDDLKENNARKLLSKETQQREKSFQKKLIQQQIQLENFSDQSTEYQNIISEIGNTKLSFNKFKLDIEKQYPEYFSIKYKEHFNDLRSLREYLKKSGHQAFVAYFMGDSATFAMSITQKDTKLLKLPKIDSNQTKEFLNNCADLSYQINHYSGFIKSSNLIYNHLVTPLNLPKGRIIISNDGQFIPFESMSKSAQKANYLVNDFAISYVYSANFLLQSLEKERNMSWKNKLLKVFNQNNFLGVAPIHFDKSLNVNDLVKSEKSIKNIKSNYYGELLLNQTANSSEFLTQFPKFELVQIYTHANADTTQKEPIFYLQNEKIRVSEILQNEKINTKLIVLSACKTAYGRNIKGEGVFSLSRGFSALGIPSLITTLWSVDEKATYQITELFHKNLKEGYSKDLALQRAKIAYLKESNNNRFSNLWASTILIGDTSPIENIYSNWLILFMLFFSIISLIFLYEKYK